jgi:ribonuclease HI
MKKINIFTDGSSRGNPGPGGWGAIVVYPDSKDEMKVDELGGREDVTTNNRMEMTAALCALTHFDGYYESFDGVSFVIHTDSSYLINGVTKWAKNWAMNNWITKTREQVLNKDIWQKLLEVTEDKKVEWTYIAGHSGIPANERCDEIATSFADQKEINLFKGNLSDYSVDTKNLAGHLIGKKKVDKSRSQAKAFSYVSLVGGKIFIDKTWKDCEARVKGVKGVRYKKALSQLEEVEISKEFLAK